MTQAQVVKNAEVYADIAETQKVNLRGETGHTVGQPWKDKERGVDMVGMKMDHDGATVSMPKDRISTRIRSRLSMSLSGLGDAWDRIFGRKG